MPKITEVFENDELTGYNLEFGITAKSRRTCYKPVSCKDCPLFEKLAIEPDLSTYKSILTFGEGPGREERRQMKGFTGPSGSLYRAVLDDTGASEYGVGFSNVVWCEGSKELSEEDYWVAIDYCEPRCWDLVDRTLPKLIVPAGEKAKQVFIPKEKKGILSTAGSLYTAEDGSYNVLPIIHPAYIMRYPKSYETWWDQVNEIRLFFAQKPGPFISHFKVTEDHFGGSYLSTFRKWIKTLDKQARTLNEDCAIDFETTSFSPWDQGTVIGFEDKHYSMGDVLCISLCVDGMNSYVFPRNVFIKLLPEIKLFLEKYGVTCHNGQFDIPFLNKYGIHPYMNHDTMLMDYSMNEEPSHPLKRISRRHLGMEDWSEVLSPYLPKRKDSYALVPPPILQEYCGYDTASTKSLSPILWNKMDEDTDKRIYNTLLIPCANMFINIREEGIRVDVSKCIELNRKWQREENELLKKLKSRFGLNNPNSAQQVSRKMVELEIIDFEVDTGRAVLDSLIAECNERGNDRGAEFLQDVLACRQVRKARTTFLTGVVQFTSELDCRIHPDTKLFGTVTGRLTIGEPSLLNYPKATRFSQELREVFIPDPGYVWFHYDQAQFELRVYAVVNDDKTMKGLLRKTAENPKPDPHRVAAVNLLGEAEYERLNKLTLGYTRTAVKTVVFGRVYLRGVNSIADQFGWEYAFTEDRCRKIDAMFTEIPRYRENVLHQLNTEQELVNPLGRRRRFPIITNENYHECKAQACNFPVQSTASDLNLLGMLKLHGLKDPDIKLFFPVHDAIEGQIRESKLAELQEIVEETMKNVPRDILGVEDLEFDVDGKVGSSWGQASMDWL